ncbi:MAG TPA: TetR/AcrR family transcriptional regulator [Kofleriaceae bacterium]|nr:TetR/AcrR family transcriptional regulator [Kofleriaceae bacterium]
MPEAARAPRTSARRDDGTKAPRTQQQRRDETRRALLDAAVESLIEVGFARTTTLEVQRRANASRGALLHHFPAKTELLVAAVDHLAEMRARELKMLAASLPDESAGRARTEAVLELLWQCFSGTFFQVAMELRTAARTDPELRPVLVAAERALRDRIVLQAKALFGKDVAEHPGLERAIDFTLQFMIGAAMTAVLHKDDGRLRDLIEDFKSLFPAVLTQATTKRRKQGTR